MSDRTPRSVIAEVIDDLYGRDGYDVAGTILDALTDEGFGVVCERPTVISNVRRLRSREREMAIRHALERWEYPS